MVYWIFCGELPIGSLTTNFIGVLTPVAGVGLSRVGLNISIPTLRKRILLDA